MKKVTKPLHGGKRIGAGRKPKYNEATVTVSFRVPESMKEKVKQMVHRILKSPT